MLQALVLLFKSRVLKYNCNGGRHYNPASLWVDTKVATLTQPKIVQEPDISGKLHYQYLLLRDPPITRNYKQNQLHARILHFFQMESDLILRVRRLWPVHTWEERELGALRYPMTSFPSASSLLKVTARSPIISRLQLWDSATNW